MMKALIFACAAAFTVSAAYAQSAAPPPAAPPAPIAIKAVKPGLFMVTGQGGNSTVRVGTDGVILVDTKNQGQQNYDDLLAQIRTVTDKPVKFVFVTHVHGDHTGNTGRFIAAGAPVIAHEGLPPLLALMQPNPANPAAFVRPAAPTVTFKDKTEVKVGGATAIGLHFFAAHTGGDTLVFFPDLKVISFGDELVIGQAPNPDYGNGGSVANWIKTFDEVLKLDFDTAIPGHGPNAVTKADVKAFRDRLELFLKRANEQIKAGVPKDQLISKIKVDDFGWTLAPAAWTQPARLDGFYAEASK